MGNNTPTAAITVPPGWALIPSGGYYTLLHQPEANTKAQPPAIIPLPPSESMGKLVPHLGAARWPRGVPEFDDEIEKYECVARWLTLRSAAALSFIAQGVDPPRCVFELLHVTPFGYTAEDFEHSDEQQKQAAASGETLPSEPDLTMLSDRLPQLSRMVLVALASRVRNVLDPHRVPIMPVHVVTMLTSSAVFRPDPVRDAGWSWPAKERFLTIELAAALMSAWSNIPRLRVPLACAYAAETLLTEWAQRGRSNADIRNADPVTAEHMRMQTYDGPDPTDPVPAWALRLLWSNEDVEVWRA